MVKYGFCNLALVPMRREANNVSEQVSQVLFGETFDVLETRDDKCLIKTHHDLYEGWISRKQFLTISSDDLQRLNITPDLYCSKLLTSIEQIDLSSGHSTTLPVALGAVFHDYRFVIGDYAFSITENDAIKPSLGDMESMIEFAKSLLNAPYLWGGRSVLGIDCSGFTQLCYRLAGIKIQRDAWQQANEGLLVEDFEKSQQGDLCFFTQSDNETISHTGIYLGKGNIIHACGKVRIDRLTNEGILDINTNEYSHKLIKVKTWSRL